MSKRPTLIIGSKNYSSWSLRPWLLLRQFDVPFNEIVLPLDTPEYYARIGDYSPTGRVPALQDDDLWIWDSLAIAEYINEKYLNGRGWPSDIAARAYARAISAEMHSGFAAMRKELPMNCRKRVSDHRVSDDAAHDIARVKVIWREARERYGGNGNFLFGQFGISDAMFAPVVLRFVGYGVALDSVEKHYMDAMLALPTLRQWIVDAANEPVSAEHEQLTP